MLTFTPATWSQAQGLVVTAVHDNAAGAATSAAVSFYVAAPADPGMNGNSVEMPVLDARTPPGENANFPWVRLFTLFSFASAKSCLSIKGSVTAESLCSPDSVCIHPRTT
jgi:hypothetical protein